MQTLRTLQTVLECICSHCMRSPVPKRDQGDTSEVDVVTIVIGTAPTEEDVRNRALSTWPLEQLEKTLRSILAVNGSGIENEEFDRLLAKVAGELHDACPFNLNEQYDFCIICSSDDYDEAHTFQKYIESEHKLIGYMVSEAVVLGRDHFETYEDVVERSSKVIFYLTENFTNDEVCCHLARNTFVAPDEETKNKFIPIVDDLTTKLPDSMLLVEKLVKSNTSHIGLRLQNVFNDSVRKEKDRRNLMLQVNLDTKRFEILEQILIEHGIVNQINCSKT